MTQNNLPFKVDVLFTGFSGKLTTGGLGWSSLALIQKDGHNILVDTGGPVVRGRLKGLLEQRGLSFRDIDMILLTHLHSDHVHNLDFFPHATIVFSNADWEYVHSVANIDFDAPEVAFGLIRAMDKKLLFEDGEEILPGLTTMFIPGHTPGCVAYVLDQNGEKWAFTGDAAKNRGEMTTMELQITLDADAHKKSIQRILATCDRVLPGHDTWLRIRDGKVIPEAPNEITFEFAQGITANGGQTHVTIRLD